MIETALISLPSRADDVIFGRPLLERLIILCERAGIRHFLIEAPKSSVDITRRALGRFRDRPEIDLIESLPTALAKLDPATPCLHISGNLIIAKSQLSRALSKYMADGAHALRIVSTDPEHGGIMRIGRVNQLLDAAAGSDSQRIAAVAGSALPFALNGRPEDRDEAEVRLARAVREESVSTDALMARIFDRKLSWRISLPLARNGIAPNAVTIANTGLGIGCAAMLASTSYWLRVIGALLFVVSITIDGVDGELARLRMVESDFGGKLDVFTDNIVHVAIFAGLLIGCYRVSHSHAYLYLWLALLVGFASCAVAVEYALRVSGPASSGWVSKVERATGRDFAYIVALLAIINRLEWFAWGTTAGTFIFAGVLWALTTRQRHTVNSAP